MSEDFVVGSVMTLVFGVLGGLIVRKVIAAFDREAGGQNPEQKETFWRSFSAPQQFLEQMAVSCDPVLVDWARRVSAQYAAILIGDLNFTERWEKAFMAHPPETTLGGYYVNWSQGLQYDSGKYEVTLNLSPPYADYRFGFSFSINGVRVRVVVRPGSISGEKCFPQMEDIREIFGGWKNLS